MHQDTVRVLVKEKNGGGSVRKAKLLKSWAWHDRRSSVPSEERDYGFAL